ncbi:hypothetical protein FOQG_14467 [Fusarium oxysporum f. sp. raphani 54005]|uniref:Secreted protein n=2 Tax=Fusarium oxysporum TaxID=5507 RepID=X0CEH3_FUSOX|nr:hypothetical protein FOVG_14724 [Fusarium oxysporum f. sp. pisi HDV247]EXK81037.1 hypothetical protein FOQG_14467 [Fusarium oxysporum f. sp. raphani 54005]
MKFSAITTLATFLAIVNASLCTYDDHPVNGLRYYIGAEGVPDVLGICNGFWDNVKPQCGGDWQCGQAANGDLHAEFQAYRKCLPRFINDGWWYATKNQWGSIECKLRQ